MLLVKRLAFLFLFIVGAAYAFHWVTTHFDIPALRVPATGVGMDPVVRGNELLWRLRRAERGPKNLKRGDIVAYKSRDDPNTFFVGRVIGLPGERVKIAPDPTKSVKVWINGAVLDESAWSPKAFWDSLPETHVPRGCLFLLVDLRQDEEERTKRFEYRDSRKLGFIPYEKVLGKIPK